MVHLATGVEVFSALGAWWWRETVEGEYYEATRIGGPYETAREAYLTVPKEGKRCL